MLKQSSNTGLKFLAGLIIFSPLIYSSAIMNMELAQEMYFFCVSIILFFIYLYRFKAIEKIGLNKTLIVLVLIFPFTFFTAIFNSSSSFLILQLTKLMVPFAVMLITVFLFLIFGEETFFKVLSISVVISITLFSLLGLLEVYGIIIIKLPTIIGPGSTLGHRSFAAEYLLSALPIILILKNYIQKKQQPVLMIAAFINVSFLLFTRNRSAIIILAASLLLLFLFIAFQKGKRDKIKLIITSAAVVIVSLLFALQPVKGTQRPEMGSTIETFFDTDFKSNNLRLKFWDASLQMITSKPLTGIGLMKWSGYFPKYYGEYFDDKNIYYVQSIHSHNEFLELASENGIVSPIILMLIIFVIAISLWKKAKADENYFFILLSFLITIAFSLVAFPLHKFSSYFFAAISAGIALTVNNNESKNIIKTKYNHLKYVFLFLLIIGFIVSFIRIKSEVSIEQAIYLKDRKQYVMMLQKLDEVSQILYPFDPARQPVDYYRGLGNYFLRKLPEALQINLEAINSAPYNPLILRNIAAIYYAIGNREKAEQLYEDYIKLFPNCINPQLNLLWIYDENKEKAKAEKLLADLLKKAPDNPKLIELKNKLNSN